MTWLYDDPESLNYEFIDEPIRNLVKQINDSDWLKTEESCCGHPVNEPSAWGTNAELYLRVVVCELVQLKRLFFMVDRLREPFKNFMGHVSLCYDRTDKLGSHWYLSCKYNKFEYRSLAIEFMEIAFKESSIIVVNGIGCGCVD